MEIGIILLGLGEAILGLILWPYFWWMDRNEPEKIPKNDEPILKLSATKLAEKIRNRELKSEDVVRVYINRIREVNPVINAVVEERYSSAIEEARAVDKKLSEDKRKPKKIQEEEPLLGVPVTIKESCGLGGLGQCVGSLLRTEVKAQSDGKAVALLKQAGAIPLVTTTTPELCLSWETVNLVTGRTKNPYNTNRTSGGSSGGEGAILGAGASVIGLGSDIAGSIRVPCHFNGIFGHKPTGGIVSVDGHYPNSSDEEFSNYLVLGPMTRYAEDLSLIMKVLCKNKLNLSEKVDLSKLTVYYMEELGNKLYDIRVHDDIKRGIRKTARHLEQHCGSTISDTKFLELYDSAELSVSTFFSVLKDIPNVLQNPTNPKENRNLIIETIKSLLGLSQHSIHTMLFYTLKETNIFIPRSMAPSYRAMLLELKKRMEAVLDTDGIFLFPTFPISAFHHYGLFCNTAGVSYTMVFNLMGLPSTHVPLGLGEDNLPYGIQVIAASKQDRLCLAVAEELEKAFGGWVPPPTN